MKKGLEIIRRGQALRGQEREITSVIGSGLSGIFNTIKAMLQEIFE